MCDWTPVRNWFIVMFGTLLGALALVIWAAVDNASWWLAWKSSVLMLLAGGATFLAGIFCEVCRNNLKVFCECAGSRCAGACTNMNNILLAVTVVLGIQSTACFSAAAIAWIPIVGLVPIIAISGALLAQVFLLISGIAFINDLAGCQKAPPTLQV